VRGIHEWRVQSQPVIEGIGCQRIFTEILKDELNLGSKDVRWSYTIITPFGRKRRLRLDARIPTDRVSSRIKRARIKKWIDQAAKGLGVPSKTKKTLQGAVFEVRQANKSRGSRALKAQVSNASNAYARNYLPVILLLSDQIDPVLEDRYRRAKWLVLRGVLSGTTYKSTYSFLKEVVGYDLAALFRRNSKRIRKEVGSVLKTVFRS